MAQAGSIYKNSRIFDPDKQSLFDEVFIHDKHPTGLHRILVSLGFQGILTTNYDHLIEDAYALVFGRSLRAYLSTDLAVGDLQFHPLFLAKLHGDAYNWRTVVLGLDDYRNAVWPTSVLPVLKDKTLLVTGFGGRDHLVNQLLLKADTSHVYIVMPAKEVREYGEYLIRSCGQVPEHIKLVSVEHGMLEKFLERLRTYPGIPRVIDSTWGRMPPHPVAMDFPYANGELRSFYNSTRKAICLVAPASSGLSSFIASEAEAISNRGTTTVCRLEGKTWLPLQAYVLHLLASLPRAVYDAYLAARREEVGGWNDLHEARALAHGLDSLPEPVLIFHEHADRLSPKAIDFWEELLKSVDSRFKLVFTGPAPVLTSADVARVDLGRPTDGSILALCQQYACDREIGAMIARSLPSHDLQTLVLVARLVASKTASLDESVRCALSAGIRGLLEMALTAVEGGSSALRNMQLLKACAIFRTPRNERALAQSAEISDDTAVRNGLELLCSLGLLIPPHVGQVEAYAMSTTLRAIVDEKLQWDKGERSMFACRAANYFRRLSVEELDKNKRRSETDVIGAVPLASCALFHYLEARNFDSCAQIICGMRPYLQNICHFGVLDTWVNDINSNVDQALLSPRSRYALGYLQARLDRVKSIPSDFEKHLSVAEKALQEVAVGGEQCDKEQADLRFEKGILLTMQRKYPEALKTFQEEYSLQMDLKSLERIIQTLLSLGKLREAEQYLAELTSKLEYKERTHGPHEVAHDHSMACRHRSTLATLRLLLYDYRPRDSEVTREALLDEAVEAAKSCRQYSEDPGPSISRHTVSDKTGLGIAELKLGQAYYAAQQYSFSSDCATKGAGLLAGFPNSRWWRMSCHDLAARSLAMLNEVPSAKRQLNLAISAFEDSGKDDIVRECELIRTQGILSLADGKPRAAIELFQKSLDFKTIHHRTSPYIEVAHLSDLAQAQLALGELRQVMTTLRRALKVRIDW
jgi:tetratricopeptide (TPR) repeat protein